MPTTQRRSLRDAAKSIGLVARDREEDFRFAQKVESGLYTGFQETIRRKLNARSVLEIRGPGGGIRFSTMFEDDDKWQVGAHATFPVTSAFEAVNDFEGLARGRGRSYTRLARWLRESVERDDERLDRFYEFLVCEHNTGIGYCVVEDDAIKVEPAPTTGMMTRDVHFRVRSVGPGSAVYFCDLFRTVPELPKDA